MLPEEKGFLSRVGGDIESRAQDVAEIQGMHREGMISKPVEIAMMAGKGGAGVIGDIGGEVLKSTLDVASDIDEATGGYIGGGLSRIGGAIGSLPSLSGGTIGEEIPKEIGTLAEGYGEFAEEHPIISTGLEAGANLAMITPILKYGEDIIDAAGKIKHGLKKNQINKISAEDLRAKGGELFKIAEQKGGSVKPAFWDEYAQALVERWEYDSRWALYMDYIHGRSCKVDVFREGDKLFINKNWLDHTDEQLQILIGENIR